MRSYFHQNTFAERNLFETLSHMNYMLDKGTSVTSVTSVTSERLLPHSFLNVTNMGHYQPATLENDTWLSQHFCFGFTSYYLIVVVIQY